MCEKKTIVELREIYSCLALSQNIGAKAFMTFLLSSGMDRGIAMKLTVNDFINACNIWPILDFNQFKYNTSHENSKNENNGSNEEVTISFNIMDDDLLSILLNRNPDNIIPIWTEHKKGKFKLNFSSPESSFYIFLHLKERMDAAGLEITDKLFDISDNVIDDTFKISEHLTDMGSYYPFSANGISHKFTTRTLKRFFKDQFLKHFPDYENGKLRKYEGEYYSQYKVSLIKLFTSGLSEEDDYCRMFANNLTRLLNDYKKFLPYVTAKNYDVVRPSWDEPSDLEIKFNAKVDKLMESDKRSFTDLDVTQLVVNYAKFKSKDDVDIHQIIDFAVKDNEIGYFEDSTLYLDNLMVKPSLKFDLESIIIEDIEIHPLTYEPMLQELILKLDTKGIFKKYNINKDILTYNIMGYLDDIEDKGKPIYLTNNDILELCFISLMDQ